MKDESWDLIISDMEKAYKKAVIIHFHLGLLAGLLIAGVFMLIAGCASTEQPRPYFEKSSQETQIA